MNNKKILLIGYNEEKIAEIRSEFPKVEFILATNEDAKAKAKLVHAIVPLHGTAFTEVFSDELFSSSSILEWIYYPGAGIEEYLTPVVINSSVIITNGKILQGPEVADQALALLLLLTRNIDLVLKKDLELINPKPIELMNKTVLVFGCGGVGTLIAERLCAFGMNVLGVNNDYLPYLSIFDKMYMPEQLMEALPNADVVICAAPHTKNTEGIFGEREFAVMKKGAIFINVSRGKLVQTEALTKAVQAGKFKAVGLDVTDPEPLPANHPLRFCRRVVITPHMAGLSDCNHARSFELIKINLKRYLKGLPLINQVDKQLGY